MSNSVKIKCARCGMYVNLDETFTNACAKCIEEQDAVLDLPEEPITGLDGINLTHNDTRRLDWLDKHCTIRISRKGNIKIRISAEPNGVNCTVLRDYIDNLMEQGAR